MARPWSLMFRCRAQCVAARLLSSSAPRCCRASSGAAVRSALVCASCLALAAPARLCPCAWRFSLAVRLCRCGSALPRSPRCPLPCVRLWAALRLFAALPCPLPRRARGLALGSRGGAPLRSRVPGLLSLLPLLCALVSRVCPLSCPPRLLLRFVPCIARSLSPRGRLLLLPLLLLPLLRLLLLPLPPPLVPCPPPSAVGPGSPVGACPPSLSAAGVFVCQIFLLKFPSLCHILLYRQ